MFTILEKIIENYQLFIAIGVLLVLLALSGNLTKTVRQAKNGLKESMTPLGFVILLILGFLVYQIYITITETL